MAQPRRLLRSTPRGHAGFSNSSGLSRPDRHANVARGGVNKINASGLKVKDLIGVPWRVAFALQADGWWLRSDIIWAKPNPMPSSVEDRPTSSHEYIFLLSKSARYFYDSDAIREPLSESSKIRLAGNVPAQAGSSRANGGKKTNGPMRAVGDIIAGANKRDVWTVGTEPYSEAHFATFPREIPVLCIRAGSKPGDIVLDPFMGSGTTAEVAESLGRRWVEYELNPEYHSLIAKRTAQKGLFA